MYSDPYERVRNRPTIYDGKGHITKPYQTSPHSVNRRWIRFHARFYTQNGGYNAYYTIGRYDTKTRNNSYKGSDQLTTPRLEHEFSNELVGFKTNNPGNNSLSTMDIDLVGFRDWEQILQVNDYCALTVEECYPDDLNWLKETQKDPFSHGAVEERTLMTGLISNVHTAENPQGQGKIYVITCNGMEKILSNITLGLPPKAQIGSVNLLFDINGSSNPANESFPFGSGSNVSSKSNSNSPKLTGGERERQYISWCKKENLNAAQTAGLAGNSTVEAGVSPTDWSGGTNNWFGISEGGNGVHIPASVSVTDYLNYTILHKGHESFPPLSECPSGFYKYRSTTRGMSAYKCADWWCDNVEHTQAANGDSVKGQAAEAIYQHIK